MNDCRCHSHNGFRLSPSRSMEGLAQREMFSSDVLTRSDEVVTLDKVGSVSGSILSVSHWDDAVINEQYRRFLNGS